MKLQGFTIIFTLVAIPLILILTYYIQLQVDTITLQNEYDSKLLDATYDAMSSFELNTANEDLSTVSDSLRTIIEASNNIFFNTLATNLGLSNASKSYVEPYIPAILYTLYDGYYISAPTQVPEVCVDSEGKAVSVDDMGVTVQNGEYKYSEVPQKLNENQKDEATLAVSDLANEEEYGQLLYVKKDAAQGTYTADISEAELSTKNVLKTYMPYSARYKRGEGESSIDITVIYTLDNYVTIEGTVGNVYYTKSGYLLPRENLVSNGTDGIKISNDNLLNYNQNDAQDFIEDGNGVTVRIDSIEFTSPTTSKEELESSLTIANNELSDAQEILYNINQGTSTENRAEIENRIRGAQNEINRLTYELEQMSAVTYYVKAAIFSNWVYNTLSEIEEQDIVEISGQSYSSINNTEVVTHSFEGSTKKIFDTNGNTQEGVTEIAVDSPFYNHKLAVIRNSIQYNLNLAMSTYNSQTSRSYNYEMPVMQNEEWDRILTNISIVSFMQGYSCGLKIYNNYMVVSSTNNEIIVSPENIYYVPRDNFSDETTEYHRIDCPDIQISNEYISFSSKEVKYDKIYNKNNSFYIYDHKNLACYNCINDGNYSARAIFTEADPSAEDLKLRRAYYIAVGKERNDVYKMNAIDNSQGYEVVYDLNAESKPLGSVESSKNISEIKTIEIVLDTIRTRNITENLRYQFSIDGVNILSNFVQPNSIISNQTNYTTITINLDPGVFSNNNNIFRWRNLGIRNDVPNSTAYINQASGQGNPNSPDDKAIFAASVKYIRIIYK